MARYYYDRYSIRREWVEGSLLRNIGQPAEGCRTVLTSQCRYYDSVSWDGTKFVGVGSGYLRDSGSSPMDGLWFLDNVRDNATTKYAHQITSRIFELTLGTDKGTYFRVNQKRMTYTNFRGSFLSTIVAEDGAYPDNGARGSYWYIKRNKAFPDFKVKADGQLRTSEEGWVKINGVLRPIEQMWVKVNGVIKEV